MRSHNPFPCGSTALAPARNHCMKPLKDLCIPRDSVFDIARRDTVLNLTHLTAEKITAKDFFEENYVTEGMKTLLTEAFRRLQKKSEQAVFKLTQAMGGGKTHNLITLGMLAKHPEFRGQVLKDLYARFRENQGFQQTRALIRLMRIIASRLWQSGEAAKKHLISVHDIDLNEPETLSEIRQINPSLENAVSHDIAAQGKAVAEAMDQNLGGTDARDVCRLMFVASLANVPNAVLGLSIPELVGQGLNAQLKQFFDQTTFKNRVAVLTGSRNTFDSLVARLKRPDAKASGVRISVTGDRWAELNLHELVELDAAQLGEAVEAIRKLPVTGNGQVEVSAGTIHFPTGQRLLDWLNETKTDVKPGEVKQ